MLLIALICAAVLVGALSQRLTGMGFALVSSPFLVLLLDPLSGVVLVSACGVFSSLIVLSRTAALVDWRLAKMLGLAAVVGTIPGALLAGALPVAILETLIGSIVVVALAASLILRRYGTRPLRQGWGSASVFGVVSGTMNAAAGVGGPALSSFAVLTRWSQPAFAATIQPIFVVTGAVTIVSKVALDPAAWPTLGAGTWVAVLAALILGQVLGEWCSRVVPVRVAFIAMLGLAFFGGILTIARGTGLLG